MAVEYFNSFGGYSAGIPPVPVIDANGNVISNFNNFSGNVSANVVYAAYYKFANGQPLTVGAAGSNTQLQFNNQGAFAGIPNVTWNGNILNLGSVANLSIGGGLNGYFLQTDGEGGLTWAPAGNGGGGNGNPGGANTQVQFNDEGDFGGDAGFTYNKNTNILTVNQINANYFVGNGSQLSNLVVNTANYVSNPVQSNITSVGTMTALTVAGPVTLGPVANVHISGGGNGYILTTNGAGNLAWENTGRPGGANTQVQYNDDGNFNGSAFFTFNEISHTVQVAGTMIANVMQLGSGGYKFATSEVLFAETSSTNRQVIYSIPVSECSGVDFEIIGTNSISERRQSVKISSLYYAGVVQYNEYAGLNINGGIGDFEVSYNPGDVINPPSLDLSVTPISANHTVYKMLISILAQ
jgi:hypothetical protein